MKDYFSEQSKVYAAFRPTYPNELYDFLLKTVSVKGRAWDCGTGNGQVARVLATHFAKVDATDISSQQLANAPVVENITYSVSPAEKTNFADHSFDLITVGQALHWFDREAFYREVKRVGKPGATVAVWGYATLSVSIELDEIIGDFYENIVGPYWDDARRLVEEEYKSIEFPFQQVKRARFAIEVDWTPQQLAGYFESWSATQKYIKVHNHNPVPAVMTRLGKLWTENELRRIKFPVFVLSGIV
jgi:SAM-dependent methyltransferase